MESGCDVGGRSSSDKPCARSFDCIFCKRGFSNAQALGGHMNLHRKDKAKAKLQGPRSPFAAATNTAAASRRLDREETEQTAGQHGAAVEELDLELRLGRSKTSTPSWRYN